MARISYEQLSKEVDVLFSKKITDEKEIEEHCDFIRQYIEYSGWEIDSYIRAMFGWEELNVN
jgi:hypothetical protein